PAADAQVVTYDLEGLTAYEQSVAVVARGVEHRGAGDCERARPLRQLCQLVRARRAAARFDLLEPGDVEVELSQDSRNAVGTPQAVDAYATVNVVRNHAEGAVAVKKHCFPGCSAPVAAPPTAAPRRSARQPPTLPCPSSGSRWRISGSFQRD